MSKANFTKRGELDYLTKVDCLSKHKNTLDTMIRKEPGMYQCLDCVGKHIEREYLREQALQSSLFLAKETSRIRKLQKVIAWAFG